jgi:hypothetical protein
MLCRVLHTYHMPRRGVFRTYDGHAGAKVGGIPGIDPDGAMRRAAPLEAEVLLVAVDVARQVLSPIGCSPILRVNNAKVRWGQERLTYCTSVYVLLALQVESPCLWSCSCVCADPDRHHGGVLRALGTASEGRTCHLGVTVRRVPDSNSGVYRPNQAHRCVLAVRTTFALTVALTPTLLSLSILASHHTH